MPAAAASSSSSKKGVSFSDAVLSSHPDRAGAENGKAVLIQEEPDVFVNAFLGRMTRAAAEAAGANPAKPKQHSTNNSNGMVVTDAINIIDGPPRSMTTVDDDNEDVDFENLVVRMGLVKCGYRYQIVLPLPDYFQRPKVHQQQQHEPKTATEDISSALSSASSSSSASSMNKSTRRSTTTTVRILEQSIDPDLRGDIGGSGSGSENEKEEGEQHTNEEHDDHDNDDGTSSSSYRLTIALGPTRRGPYRGRFALEWSQEKEVEGGHYPSHTTPSRNNTTRTADTVSSLGASSHDDTTTTTNSTATDNQNTSQEEEGEAPPSSAASVSLNNNNNNNRRRTRTRQQRRRNCIMSVQVEATVMGPDMGTPKLRNGVRRLGKIVGYDSDEETTWHGF